MARHLVPLSPRLIALTWRSCAHSFSRRSQVRTSAWQALCFLGVGTAAIITALALLERSPSASDPLLGAVLVTAMGLGCVAAGAIVHPADPLDERTVALLGRGAPRAAVATLLASALAPASLVLLGLAMLVATTSMRGDEPLQIALATLLVFLNWWLLGRLGVRIGRGLSEYRLGREVGRLAGYGALLVAAPIAYALLFLPWREALAAGAAAAAGALEWLPPASALTIGDAPEPLTRILPAAALVLVLLTVEVGLGVRSARRAMRDVSSGGRTRLGFFRNAAGSGTKAVAARVALAWLRDGRYGVVLSTVIILPMLFVIPLAVGGLPLSWLSLLPVPLFAFLLGWALHNDTAYDSTALWLHVTSGMRGIVDRLGRSVPALVLGTIVVAVGAAVTAWFAGSEMAGVVTLAVALALLGTAVGGSAVMSAWRPYPVARPGDSPFAQPIRSWGDALVMHPVAGLVEILLCGHVIWLGVVSIREDSWGIAWAALGVGAATGAVLCLAGLLLGGWVFGKRSWKLLEFAQSY